MEQPETLSKVKYTDEEIETHIADMFKAQELEKEQKERPKT